MGCKGSKSDVVGNDSPVELDISDAPEVHISQLKVKLKELTVVKSQLLEILSEKYGLEKLLEGVREELMTVTSDEVKAKEEYNFMLRYAMERDADDVYRAMQSTYIDKPVLIDILTARTKWQLEMIAVLFEEKYGVPLIKEIQRNLTTSLGVLTGSQSGLGRLLLWVCTDQAERDSQILASQIKDMDAVIEIVSTRSNRELRAALDHFKASHGGKELIDVIRPRVYKNFGNMLAHVLECRRDESGLGFDEVTATQVAAQLEHAASKKDAETYIRIFSNISSEQYESLNASYNHPGGVLEALGKFSGDFHTLMLARCTERLHYLCYRLSADKESIPRILGCLSRKDCQALRELFDANRDEFGHGKTLCEVLKESITKESFLAACLNLVSGDTHVFPLGVDREKGEDEDIINAIGTEDMEDLVKSYSSEKTRVIGEQEIARLGIEVVDVSKKKLPIHLSKKQIAEQMHAAEEEIATTSKKVAEATEEVTHSRDLYFTVFKHVTESKQWAGLYSTYLEMLHKHVAAKDTAAARSFKPKSGTD